jgi:hypothetical protein
MGVLTSIVKDLPAGRQSTCPGQPRLPAAAAPPEVAADYARLRSRQQEADASFIFA